MTNASVRLRVKSLWLSWAQHKILEEGCDDVLCPTTGETRCALSEFAFKCFVICASASFIFMWISWKLVEASKAIYIYFGGKHD